MSKTKKIIITIASILLCALIVIAVICKSNQNVQKIIKDDFGSSISVVLDNPSDYGLSDIDASSDIEILNEININNISNDKGNVISIPVVIDGNIKLIYSISLTACSYNVSIGKDYAPLLNEMRKNGYNEVYIIQDEYTFYAISDNHIYKQSGQEITQVDEKDLDFTIQDNMQKSDLSSVNDDYTQTAVESLKAAYKE